MNYFILLLILIFRLEKKQLAVLEGKLCHDRARPKHMAVKQYVVAEDLGEDPSVLQQPVPCQIHVISGHLILLVWPP
jgi:hypothetical protein